MQGVLSIGVAVFFAGATVLLLTVCKQYTAAITVGVISIVILLGVIGVILIGPSNLHFDGNHAQNQSTGDTRTRNAFIDGFRK